MKANDEKVYPSGSLTLSLVFEAMRALYRMF